LLELNSLYRKNIEEEEDIIESLRIQERKERKERKNERTKERKNATNKETKKKERQKE
jgi:hypothetical protein